MVSPLGDSLFPPVYILVRLMLAVAVVVDVLLVTGELQLQSGANVSNLAAQ